MRFTKSTKVKLVQAIKDAWFMLNQHNYKHAKRNVDKAYSYRNKLSSPRIKKLVESIHAELSWYIIDAKLGESKQERHVTHNFLVRHIKDFSHAYGISDITAVSNNRKEALASLMKIAKVISKNSFKKQNLARQTKIINQMQKTSNHYLTYSRKEN